MRAPGRRSAFHARNAGAAVAAGELAAVHRRRLRPGARPARAALPSRSPAERCALVAGEARGAREQTALLARWARSRRGPDRLPSARRSGPRPAGTTREPARAPRRVRGRRGLLRGALGRRRRALLADPGARLGARVPARARWSLTATPRASAPSSARRPATAPAAAGCAPPTGPAVPAPPLARPLARALGGALVWALALRFERAAFKLVDGAVGGGELVRLPARRQPRQCSLEHRRRGCGPRPGRPPRSRSGRAGRSRAPAAGRRPRPARGPRGRAGTGRRARRAARASGSAARAAIRARKSSQWICFQKIPKRKLRRRSSRWRA